MTELLYGHRSAATLAADHTLARGGADDIRLTDVEIHYCLFELPMKATLERLPPALHPSIPAHLAITFWRCGDGPLGAFTMAWLGLACRTGIKPRHLVYGAFVDRAEVGDALRGRYGFAFTVAELTSHETYDRAHSAIALDGRTILELETRRPLPIVGRGAAVKFSPPLNAARIGAGTSLVQLEASFDFKRVARGAPHVLVYDSTALGDAMVAPHYPMSGTFSVADVNLHSARFALDPAVPAERGGAARL